MSRADKAENREFRPSPVPCTAAMLRSAWISPLRFDAGLRGGHHLLSFSRGLVARASSVVSRDVSEVPGNVFVALTHENVNVQRAIVVRID